MKYFVKRDLDGFFGLFVDNMVQLLLIVSLCANLCGMSGDQAYLIYSRILPGAAVSLLLGNLFYAWQARRLARKIGRDDITALPYGINTVSLLVYVFFVMVPAYNRTGSAELAWKMGLLACMGSGLIEFAGSFVAEWVRRNTPRAALLSTLAGIAIGFISMTFALQIWVKPLVAMVPLAIILVTMFSGFRFPLGLPGGLIAIVAGTILAWTLPTEWSGVLMGEIQPIAGWALPSWAGGELISVFQLPSSDWLGLLAIVVPMGLFNVMSSLQNIESAEAAGDSFDTRSSLAVNGVGTVIGSLLGSCFPTTIYIGHPGWKALGARAGYSSLNGLVITIICFAGAVGSVATLVPMEAGVPIVLWIGVMITAQAFQATPGKHAPAVALGLFPAIAAWGATVVMGAFMAAGGATMQDLIVDNSNSEVSGFLIKGLIVLERGYIFTCMIVAAIAAHLVDRKFFSAAIWSVIGAGMTAIGLMHSFQLTGNTTDYLLITTRVIEAPVFDRAYGLCMSYLLAGAVLALLGLRAKYAEKPFDDIGHTM